jgi:hypothetical protein
MQNTIMQISYDYVIISLQGEARCQTKGMENIMKKFVFEKSEIVKIAYVSCPEEGRCVDVDGKSYNVHENAQNSLTEEQYEQIVGTEEEETLVQDIETAILKKHKVTHIYCSEENGLLTLEEYLSIGKNEDPEANKEMLQQFGEWIIETKRIV